MATWQLALLLLGLVWGLQSIGVWIQMRHYGTVMKDIRERERDGFLGTGYVKSRLSRGTIAIVVAADDRIVRRVSIMTGRTSLAKFRERPEYVGLSLDELETRLDRDGSLADGEKEAIRKAVRQVEQFRQKGRDEALPYQEPTTQGA